VLAACPGGRRKCRAKERGEQPTLASGFFLPGKLIRNLLQKFIVAGFRYRISK